MKPETQNALSKPFPAADILWRPGSVTKNKDKCIPLAYIDARHVMDRLDQTVGTMGWTRSHRVEGEFIMCRLSIVGDDGVWVHKEDGANKSDIEGVKGGLSDSFKRAAVSFGIGRYLYAVPSSWVPIDEYKRIPAPVQQQLAQAIERFSVTWEANNKVGV